MSADYGIRLGQRMREVRETRGLSLGQVERASGGKFCAATVGSWERASREMTPERLAEYAQWLGVDIRRLLPDGWYPPGEKCAEGLGWPLREAS